jgi:large subunit ribosomal protein L5
LKIKTQLKKQRLKNNDTEIKRTIFKEIQPALKNQFGLKNIYMTPKIEKIVLNMGLGLDGNDAKILKSCEEDMAKITGQKPVITKFKKSVANFKTRKGTNAGLKVTLRKNKMYEFLDRLVNIALPRIKDFRGLSANGFDKFGNYTFGVKEHIIFPEVSFDRAEKVRGLDIVIVISSQSKDHSFALLEKMNFPFIKKGEN